MRHTNPVPPVAPGTANIGWSSFRTARAALQTVPCPSCGEQVFQGEFDLHLDGCLDAEMFASAPGSPDGKTEEEVQVHVGEWNRTRQGSAAKAEKHERENCRDGRFVEFAVHEGIEEIRESEDAVNNRDEHDRQRGLSLPAERYTRGIDVCSQRREARKEYGSREVDGGTQSEILPPRDVEVNKVHGIHDNEEERLAINPENEFLEELQVNDELLDRTLGLAGYSGSVCYDKTKPEQIRVTAEMANKVAIIHKRVKEFELSLKGPIEAFPPLDAKQDQEGMEQIILSERRATKELALLQSRGTKLGDKPIRLHSSNPPQSRNENDFGNCPVCGIRVLKIEMHAHIEICLEISGLSSAFV